MKMEWAGRAMPIRGGLGFWLVSVTIILAACAPAAKTTTEDLRDPTPLLAYYYIWFDPTSWNRAKTDYPLLGRYSSDDQEVMRQHIRWAKAAGVDGFVVSWKTRAQSSLEKLTSCGR
jgi:hypothetical protein